MVMTSLRAKLLARCRFRPLATRCWYQAGSKREQKSSMSQKTDRISIQNSGNGGRTMVNSLYLPHSPGVLVTLYVELTLTTVDQFVARKARVFPLTQNGEKREQQIQSP